MGLARASNGDLYITSASPCALLKISNGRVYLLAGSLTTCGSVDGPYALLNTPAGLDIHPVTQDVYFVEMSTHKVRKYVAATGYVVTIAGTGRRYGYEYVWA